MAAYHGEEPVIMDELRIEFEEHKRVRDKEINEQLDQLNARLKDLAIQAQDINVNLTVQNKNLEEQVQPKMDQTIETVVSGNRRLKQIIQQSTGGCTTWCPLLTISLLILALMGFLISIV